MNRLMFVVLFAAAAGLPGPLGASADLTLQVSPHVAMAPARVVIRARVARDAENRAIEIVADSEKFFRSSYIQLDGERAPAVTEVALRDLPGGEYQVSVSLFGSNGVRASATKPLRVVNSTID
jgi:hypothetical protein